MDSYSDLEAAALAHWPKLARDAGLRPQDWQARALADRIDARVARILLRLDGPGAALVLKLEARPRRPDVFAAQMQAHLDALDGFPPKSDAGIPALLAADAESQTCLMEHVAARPAAELLRGAPRAEAAAVLTRLGAWVDAFHRKPDRNEIRVFQPRHTLRYLAVIRSQIESGARTVAAPETFAAAADALVALAPRFEGRQTVTARMHGDLHLRNLLVGTRVWGIDFTPGTTVPVGHDLARLLVDLAARHLPPDEVAPGAVLPAWAEAAFFAGYKLVGPDDPSLGLLLRHRILADWWGLPASAAERSVAQSLRLDGLRRLAARTFAPS